MTVDLKSKKALKGIKLKLEELNKLSKSRFDKYKGKIKSFDNIDGLEFQKKIRNEW